MKKRGKVGLLYRKIYLYPRLCRYLKGRALDIGCGIGDMLDFRANTIGVDINPNLVDWCRKRNLDARLINGYSLPFGNHEFQSVIMDNVLEHILNPEKLLSEIYRVISHNGNFIIGVPGALGFNYDKDHKIYYKEELLVNTLSNAGFSKKLIFYMPFYSDWLNKKLRQYCIYGVFTPS